MSVLLTIGPHRFVVGSAAVANAIAEALAAAPQIERIHGGTDRGAEWTQAGEAVRILTFRVDRFAGVSGVSLAPSPISPAVQAVLGEAPRIRRRTHQDLASAAID